ncbi:PEP-CTERM sorting domain-containing protein [Microcystis aeruginosa]|uniref:PEP-CTERM sorting domain-containing protein n=1 Tax=Microcystis aeruginosa TaxID=1126 RepID=UPI001D13B3E0
MIAGSLVVATAPAQAQAVPNCAPGQFLSGFLALPNGCQNGDKIYVGNSTLTTSAADFRDLGALGIDFVANPAGDVHRFSYNRFGPLVSAGAPYVLAYKVSIAPGSGATFKDISLGSDVPAGTAGITVTKAISTGDWSGPGSVLLSTLTSTDGSTDGPVAVPTGITDLFILDTVTYASANAQFSSFTNTFTQTPQQQPSVPEPSALLGLGLLGLGGLISKTRRRG